MRTCRYKYIARWDNGYEYAPPVDTDDSLSKEVLREFGYFQRKRQSEELYDLMLDPQERENLAGEDTYASVLADMRERLKSWQMKSGDPLLARGRMELPEGAICATADSYSTKSQVLLPECEKYVAALRGLLQNPIG